jgi:hypothetical protein
MYKGLVNSPETTITNGISESDTIIYVLDPTRVPEPPNLMTLGTGTNAETVKVTEINDSAITVERGFQGIAKSWPAGTVIARNFTEYDYNALKENIEDLEANKETPAGAQAKAEAAAGAVQSELNTHKAKTASINAIGHVYAAEFTATLSTSWSGSAAPHTQTVTINGITSAHNPIIDVVMSGTYSTDQQRIEQWGYIYRAVTGTNQITFYASEKPTVSLPIRVKVVM